MGFYDDVAIKTPLLTCSRGHSFIDQVFQTKSLGQTLGQWTLTTTLTGGPGPFAHRGDIDLEEPEWKFAGREILVYGSCYDCPAFIDGSNLNIINIFIDFMLTFDSSGTLTNVARVGEGADTELWIAEELQRNSKRGDVGWLIGQYIGPMPHDTAKKLRNLAVKINHGWTI